jgi:predicted Zn-dependent protease
MLNSRYKKFIPMVFFGLMSAVFSSTSGSAVFGSSDAELEMEASKQFTKMRTELPLVADRATINFVHCVATNIVESLEQPHRDMNWELAVFDTAAANAFVMPGGKIGVFSGLLNVANNQHQLASVLGHEAAHVIARHPNKRQSRSQITNAGVYIAAIVLGQGHGGLTQTAYEGLSYGTQLGLLLPHTRAQESEADLLGLEYMANAGFDPRESVELWKKMSKERGGEAPPEFLSTHPADEKRIDALISMYPKTLMIFNKAKDQGKHPNCTR